MSFYTYLLRVTFGTNPSVTRFFMTNEDIKTVRLIINLEQTI